MLEAACAEVTQRGGVFGRRLELRVQWEGARGRVPVYAPGLLWGAAGPGATADWGQVRFIHPSAPVEGRESGRQELETFLWRHGLAPRNLAWQMNAYASARLLVEALRRSGADVSRAGLVAALESFQDVDTGVTGHVTFGSQGRVGLLGGGSSCGQPGAHGS
ncbi:ABC transporter substrate-binding protein [Archangium sp.]|uniref:ABC transporter substrate-binding protein n=1 Tax=Archangium sp. TaxID=1872627 RepID=UPI002D50A2FA|nr:ABC transporter substrate-binding protein [Archangium sp.]HYO59966.1 ABC transporter substrate-binding protein [Archangium sp.]